MEDFITCVYIQAPLGQACVGDTYQRNNFETSE